MTSNTNTCSPMERLDIESIEAKFCPFRVEIVGIVVLVLHTLGAFGLGL